MAHQLQGSVAGVELQLAGRRVQELEGQLQEVQRRYKAQLDNLVGQLEAARGVRQAWCTAVALEGAWKVVKEREQQVESARKEEAGLLQHLEAAGVKARAEEEEAGAVTDAWMAFLTELAEAKAKLRQREEELGGVGAEERGGAMSQLEAAKGALKEQEEAVAAILEASGGLGGQLEAARQLVREREEQVAAGKEAARDLQLQLEAARGVVRTREEEVAAVGRRTCCVPFMACVSTAAPARRRPHLQEQQQQQQGDQQMEVAAQLQDLDRKTVHLQDLLNGSAQASCTQSHSNAWWGGQAPTVLVNNCALFPNMYI
jgi:hypothetical protein